MRFSTLRGRECAKNTRKTLTLNSINYIESMTEKGFKEFDLESKKCFAVHGSLENVFWKSINFENLSSKYSKYDYVFSGHSHIPHYIEKFYECNNEKYRNKKKTVFINPGSVGQPRNHNPNACFAVLDMENEIFEMRTVKYDYDAEIKLFFEKVDKFYKERLRLGI